MPVTRGQIIRRGFSGQCPNCGGHALFPPRSLRIHERCPQCGVELDRGEGFYLGPWVLNYTIVVFAIVLPAIVLGVRGVIAWPIALGIAALGCLVVPALLYRFSWSLWLMVYFFFLPDRLPANGGATGAAAEN